jgi:rubredoxin
MLLAYCWQGQYKAPWLPRTPGICSRGHACYTLALWFGTTWQQACPAIAPQSSGAKPEPDEEVLMKKWQCIVCGLIYDEAEGWPDDGIAPGTRWEDVPEDWLCPDCGVGKMDFEMIAIG